MGGNAKAVYRNTGTVQIFDGRLAYAEKIDLREVQPEQFVDDVKKLVLELNKPGVWQPSSVENETIYFGSFDSLRDPTISKEEYVTSKPMMGDVDIAVPSVRMEALHDFLVQLEGKDITPNFTYIGQNRVAFSGKKVNTIFFYKRCKKFLQVDFEGMTFLNNAPEEYVKFMRSSPWRDVKEGLKGLGHKYLLTCLARIVSYKSNIVILTDKSPIHPANKVRIKLLDEIPHSLTFSKEGLRDKLKQQTRLGYPVMVEGKYAYKEVSKEESIGETSVKKIFKRLFSREPQGKDLDDFRSYMGTLDLCQKYLTRGKIESIYEYMVNVKLWGPKAQALSRDSATDDKDIKEMIIYTMESKFPFLVGNLPLEETMDKYYLKYEEREEE